MLGLSFKKDTDDLRESPLVEMAEFMIGKGMDIKIYDPNVAIAKLMGSNKDYIQNEIPHISKLLDNNLESLLLNAEVFLIGTNSNEIINNIMRNSKDKIIIDLVRAIKEPLKLKARYYRFC